MSSFLSSEWTENIEYPTWTKIAYGSAICGVVALYFIRQYRRTSTQKIEYPRDTVILHQVGRASYAPSSSPFAIKIETYLRMAKIPYQNVHGLKTSSKGKFPWIEYNGKVVADSQFCIEFLNQERGIDLNAHLSDGDKALARAFQKMMEENTYWALLYFRWFFSDLKTIATNHGFTVWRIFIFSRILTKELNGQGMGRHTEEEVYGILLKDLRSLSVFLGKKKFLFCDEPCETDCAIFGMLTVPYWQHFGDGSRDAVRKFPNLCEYCERMKARFWPDWDECITHGWTREATK